MRKPQSQPSLAGLTEAEREQLADWLRREEYAVVRDRVNQPRPEGFALNISEKPLRILWAKVALLDLINSRLPDDRKLTLAEFESLASREISLLASASSEKISEVHDTILNTVHDLATSGGNTVAQLLGLQRLADFPARAAYRDHKIEMDLHRKDMAEKRFAFAQETFAFRQQVHEDTLLLALQKPESKTDKSKKEDPLGPPARNWKDVNRRVRTMFNISEEESARRRALRKAHREEQARLAAQQSNEAPTFNPGGAARAASGSSVAAETQSPESVALLSDPSIEIPCHADFQSAPPVAAINNSPNRLNPVNPVQNPFLSTSPDPLSSTDLQSAVDAYTIKRAREYVAYNRRICMPSDQPHPEYVTEFRHCPCGHATPCPAHEEQIYGPFPDSFWKCSAYTIEYRQFLQSRHLPYRHPKEFGL